MIPSDDDPFERAARAEHAEQVRRAARLRQVSQRVGRGADSGVSTAIATFGFPYVVWALYRAAQHDWGAPSLGRAVVQFFFGTGVAFACYTIWMLFLSWCWLITRSSRS